MDVPDVDDAVARAEAAGATLAVPTMAIAGVDWLAYIKDPDGNLIGMMQSNPAAKSAATLAPAQVPGSSAA